MPRLRKPISFEERRAKIKEMYLRAYTAEEIGEAVGLEKVQASKEVCSLSEDLLKMNKVQFSDESWQPPIYNVWTFAKKTNGTSHFGNTEKQKGELSQVLEDLLKIPKVHLPSQQTIHEN